MKAKDLRIVFMGTPDFAVTSLKKLVEDGYNVVGVVTAPDKPAGRGKKLAQSSVKKYALSKDLKVLQPLKLKDSGFIKELNELQSDLMIVVAFRMLPGIVWKMPKLGTFNLHGSLLPQYRGAAPLNWAIINGEKRTGVTTFLIDDKIDTGKILFKEELKIKANDTVGDIHDQLMVIGADLVLKTVNALADGKVKAIPQSEIINRNLKPAPKIFKEDCKIDWSKNVESIRNLIRGLSPFPAAWANLVHGESGRTIQCKLFFAQKVIAVETAKPGTIDSDDDTFLNVACKDGWIEVTDLQLSGKKRMMTDDFLRGFRGINDYHFE